jgi:Dna[CI] antecedent DciA-like protein
MPKPLPLLPIASVFERDPQIASWAARLSTEAALTTLIRRHLPRPLAGRFRVSGARDGILEIAVAAGAVATVVRQRSPDLAAALKREGFDFTEIRIRVQVGTGARSPEKLPIRQLDTRGAAALFDLAATLPDGPLKLALARWQRRARGR